MLLNWYSSLKKIEKDSYDFWRRKLTVECQILAFFDTSPLHQFSKFNNFFSVCWVLGNFVSPPWKLNNPYCHIMYSRFHELRFYTLHISFHTMAVQCENPVMNTYFYKSDWAFKEKFNDKFYFYQFYLRFLNLVIGKFPMNQQKIRAYFDE